MASRWFVKKDSAIALRSRGNSIRDIEKKLQIPRSTLSGWFKSINLTSKQKIKLEKRRLDGLKKARGLASKWHRFEKQKRIAQSIEAGGQVVRLIKTNDENILDVVLAMLYLGEGSKKAEETSMGNSDPLILKTFLSILRKNYNIEERRIRCELYLRADQDLDKIKRFWAKELKLSLSNFRYAHFDARTAGSKTRKDYKGVCMVRYGNVAIKRKLMYISKKLCEKIISK